MDTLAVITFEHRLQKCVKNFWQHPCKKRDLSFQIDSSFAVGLFPNVVCSIFKKVDFTLNVVLVLFLQKKWLQANTIMIPLSQICLYWSSLDLYLNVNIAKASLTEKHCYGFQFE